MRKGGAWTARRRSGLFWAMGLCMLAVVAQPLSGAHMADAAGTSGLARLSPSLRAPICDIIRSLQPTLARFPTATAVLASLSQDLGCATLPTPGSTTSSTSVGSTTTTTLFVPGTTSTTGTGLPTSSTTLPPCAPNPSTTTVPCTPTSTIFGTSTTVCQPVPQQTTTVPCGAPTGSSTTTSTTTSTSTSTTTTSTTRP